MAPGVYKIKVQYAGYLFQEITLIRVQRIALPLLMVALETSGTALDTPGISRPANCNRGVKNKTEVKGVATGTSYSYSPGYAVDGM